jgi:hypothetical protein
VESLLTNLADELLIQDITEPSAVLGPLSDDELEAAYDFVLEHFALELLIGADKNSDWCDGKLVIDANHGPSICFKLPSMRCGSKYRDGSSADCRTCLSVRLTESPASGESACTRQSLRET